MYFKKIFICTNSNEIYADLKNSILNLYTIDVEQISFESVTKENENVPFFDASFLFIDYSLLKNSHKLFSRTLPQIWQDSHAFLLPDSELNQESLKQFLPTEYLLFPIKKRELELLLHIFNLTCDPFSLPSQGTDFFKSLVNELPDLVYTIDENGHFTFISNKISEYGYTPSDLIGKHFSTLLHPEDYNKVARDEVLKSFKGKKTGDTFAPKLFDERRSMGRGTKNLEIRVIPKDSAHSIKKLNESNNTTDDKINATSVKVDATGVFASSAPLHNQFLGTVGTISNIALESGPLVNIPEIRYRTDEEGNFIYISREIRELGYKPEELIGAHYSVLFQTILSDQTPPLSTKNSFERGDAFDDFTDFTSPSPTESSMQIKIQTRDGGAATIANVSTSFENSMWSEVNAIGYYNTQIDNSEHAFAGTIGVIRNIAARKKTEKIQNQIADKLNDKIKTLEKDIQKAQNIQIKLNTLELPAIQNMNIAALYVPSEQLSGDFFDIKQIDDILYLILGDCTGHGIEASMDATLLRAISDRHSWLLHKLKAPDIFLEHMNLDLFKYLEEDKFPTMFAASFDIKTGEMFYATAGSHTPLLIHEGGVTALEKGEGFLLGFNKESKYQKMETKLEWNDILVFFSDALIEIKTKEGSISGIAPLTEILQEAGNGLVRDTNLILDYAAFFNQKIPLSDDLTLILFQRVLPKERRFTLYTIEDASQINKSIFEDLSFYSYSIDATKQIWISLSEMIENGFSHGNKEIPGKTVVVQYVLDCTLFRATIEDEGSGFDLSEVKDPTNLTRLQKLIENNEEAEYTHGRGIWISNHYMDKVEYLAPGNKVILEKHRNKIETSFIFQGIKDFSEGATLLHKKNKIIWTSTSQISDIITEALDEIIRIYIPATYFIQSYDFIKLLKMGEMLLETNRHAEIYVENEMIRKLLLDSNLNLYSHLKILKP